MWMEKGWREPGASPSIAEELSAGSGSLGVAHLFHAIVSALNRLKLVLNNTEEIGRQTLTLDRILVCVDGGVFASFTLAENCVVIFASQRTFDIHPGAMKRASGGS